MATQTKEKRKVCFVITSFIHYSRNLLVLRELQKRDDIELSVLVGGAALLKKHTSSFGSTTELLAQEEFDIHPAHFSLEGDAPVVKTKTAGLGIQECATLFERIKPDVVIVRGDRFEVLSATIAAAYMNIPIAHIEGGDVSGSIDETVRHAITKFSQLHFVTNPDAARRVRSMGENPEYIFEVGSPDVEIAELLGKEIPPEFDVNATGSGASIDLSKPYLIVRFHPVWSESKDEIALHTKELLRAVCESGYQTLWFWPNDDTGGEVIAHTLRSFNDTVPDHSIRFMRDLPPTVFLPILKHAVCLVGNSSAGLKECSLYGTPVVDVGLRQRARLQTGNVRVATYDAESLRAAIVEQSAIGRYGKHDLYRKEGTAQTIAETVATATLYTEKSFHE